MNNSNSQNNTRPVKKVSLSQKIKSLGYDILLGGKLIPFLLLNKLTKDVYNPFFNIDYKVSDSWCSYEKLKYNLDFKKKLLKNDDYAFRIVREKFNDDNFLLKVLFLPIAIILNIIFLIETLNENTNPYTDGKFHTELDFINYQRRKDKGYNNIDFNIIKIVSDVLFKTQTNPQIVLTEQRIFLRILACENENEYIEMNNKYPFDKKLDCYDKMLQSNFFNINLEHTLYKMYIEENFDTKFRDISHLSMEKKFMLIRLELLKRGYLFGNFNKIKSKYNNDFNIIYNEVVRKIKKLDELKNENLKSLEIEIIEIIKIYAKEMVEFIYNAKELEFKLKKLNLNITNNNTACNTSFNSIDCIEWNIKFNYQDFLSKNYTFEEKEIIFNNLKPIFKDFFSKQLGIYIVEEKKRQRYLVIIYYSVIITIQREDKFSLLEYNFSSNTIPKFKSINLNNDKQKEIILEYLDFFAYSINSHTSNFIKNSCLTNNDWKNAIIKYHRFKTNNNIKKLPFTPDTKIIYYKKTENVPISNDIYL